MLLAGNLLLCIKNNIDFMHHLLIFGPPGVGKGTQAQLISEKLNLFHLSTGEVLRAAAEKGTELGLKAKELMDRGELVPDDIMIGIVWETLLNGSNIASNGFILDGFPRTVDQAKALNDIFQKLKYSNFKVIYLDATEDELLRRLLKRGRSDDNEQSIRKRFKLYKELTSPVLEFYNSISDIIKIDGLGEINEISKNILLKLDI
jgi:adenylate kinase